VTLRGCVRNESREGGGLAGPDRSDAFVFFRASWRPGLRRGDAHDIDDQLVWGAGSTVEHAGEASDDGFVCVITTLDLSVRRTGAPEDDMHDRCDCQVCTMLRSVFSANLNAPHDRRVKELARQTSISERTLRSTLHSSRLPRRSALAVDERRCHKRLACLAQGYDAPLDTWTEGRGCSTTGS
jgi:hypothetical protein